MKLASWNVNSLKVRLPQLLDWLALHRPDIICLQETKLEDDRFPVLEIEAAGYRCERRPRCQRGPRDMRLRSQRAGGRIGEIRLQAQMACRFPELPRAGAAQDPPPRGAWRLQRRAR